jgi:hypothetical protein
MSNDYIQIQIDENDFVHIFSVNDDGRKKLATSNSSIISIFDELYDKNGIDLEDFYYKTAQKGVFETFSNIGFDSNPNLDFSDVVPTGLKMYEKEMLQTGNADIDRELLINQINDLTASVLDHVYTIITDSAIAAAEHVGTKEMVLIDDREDVVLLEKMNVIANKKDITVARQ